ncbi:MAG: outer membrane protein assembly factor [Epsilonproteobacteria bacterium]|nr:MAG: outer membrane protein assembly factor [Campylobacterota bacterium]
MQHKYTFFIIMCMFSVLFADDEIKLSTHEIRFTGQQHFEEADLQDALGVKTKSFFQFWKEDKPQIQDKLLPTLEPSLKSFYDSEGFYDATFLIKETNSTVSVVINENQPIKINDINISSDYEITDLVTLQKGTIFRTDDFVSVKTEIIKQLLNDGYCSYDFDTKAYVDLEQHTVDVHYKLKKGGECTFGALTTSGLETIDDDVILSRVRALEGERFSPKLVQETSDNLYKLSAFDSVRINVDRKFYNVIPVDIVFEEMEKTYVTEAGIGYDTYVGPRIQGRITKNNFLGNAQRLQFGVSWSDIEERVFLSYFKPVLLHLYDYAIDFGAEVGYHNLEYEGFREEKVYGKGYLEYQSEKLRVRTGLAMENIEIYDVDEDNLVRAVNEGTFDLLYPYGEIVYDARDDKLNPRYGYYLSAYGELGLANDEDANAYYKTLFEGRVIHTFSELTLAAVGKYGIVDSESKDGIPESKYFFGGGMYSNRAYGYQEMGVIVSPTEFTKNGASTMLNLTLEANQQIKGKLYGAVFNDNTMLTEDSYDFSGEVISSAGLGIRYMTPVGPFKIDAAVNVNEPSDYGILFQLGQSF